MNTAIALRSIGSGKRATSLAYTRITVNTAPPAVDPVITSFTRVGGEWEVTLEGAQNTDYEFRSSTTLQFTPGDLVALSQGNPPTDPGTVDASGDFLTTDGNGDATVRMTLEGPTNFVRAQTP